MREIEQFLYHEVQLLDSGQFEAWLDLFTADAIYWVPSQMNQTDPVSNVSIVYEDLNLLRLRVHRLLHPRAHAVNPMPRTLHSITNVSIENLDTNAARVSSALLMVEHRENQQTLYAARVRHQLRRVDKDWRIVQKRVNLINCDAVHGVMSIPF